MLFGHVVDAFQHAQQGGRQGDEVDLVERQHLPVGTAGLGRWMEVELLGQPPLRAPKAMRPSYDDMPLTKKLSMTLTSAPPLGVR